MTKIAIVGLGAIGSSLAAALRSQHIIYGVEPNQEYVTIARQMRLVDKIVSFQEAVQWADMLILSGPITAIQHHIQQLAGSKRELLVMDTGSVKESMMVVAQNLPNHIRFVGGHPMAGTHRQGAGVADAQLFVNRPFFLVHELQDYRDEVQTILAPLQADFISISAAEHDALVAGISHFSHVVASTIVNVLSESFDTLAWQEFVAGGFQDTTRIAQGNPELWTQILLANHSAIRAFISTFQAQLTQLDEQLAAEDFEAVHATLLNAALIRKERANDQ
jgi:prephenate dehydrogenase